MGIEKKAESLGLSLLLAVTPVGAVASETTVNPLIAPETIEIKGEMPSQEVLDDLSQYKTLEAGYKGPEVATLKQRMYELGYFENNTVNESFTDKTAEYVKKFEKINGLPVDGIADPEMQALFFSDKARKADGELVVPEPYLSKEILPGSEEEKIIDARFKSFLEGRENSVMSS